MKDNFSTQSDKYAKYRPVYPPEMYQFLYSQVQGKDCAWDCGTGNGQVANELAKQFNRVFATDISQSQIDNALQAENITYSVQPAEQTKFATNQFDLIVVAQAIHWFDFDKFYAEVKRTAKAGAILFVTGYGKLEVSPGIDGIINTFYEDVIGKYWDEERKYIDEAYQTIPFPFTEITAPQFDIKISWSFAHLVGYLNTWSAVKHFIAKNGINPVDELKLQLEAVWDGIKTVRFPLLVRMGRIN